MFRKADSDPHLPSPRKERWHITRLLNGVQLISRHSPSITNNFWNRTQIVIPNPHGKTVCPTNKNWWIILQSVLHLLRKCQRIACFPKDLNPFTTTIPIRSLSMNSPHFLEFSFFHSELPTFQHAQNLLKGILSTSVSTLCLPSSQYPTTCPS